MYNGFAFKDGVLLVLSSFLTESFQTENELLLFLLVLLLSDFIVHSCLKSIAIPKVSS